MSEHWMPPSAGQWARRGLLLVVLGLAGCGPRPARVSGTVTFLGQPLPSGTILFHGGDGRIEHGMIVDGKYTILNAPPGLVQVSVRPHAAAPAGLPTWGRPPVSAAPVNAPAEEKRDGRYVRIPPRYLAPDTSGLSCTVGAGAQTHDIELRP